MESRFTHLRQRDTSVSMLRVKMSRRRSQSQKENRERAVNTRRHLDKLPEMDVSCLDASIAVANMSTIKEKMHNCTLAAKNQAVEERLKQLERWKARKALEKEKEKREKERKGVFKTGLYRPADTQSIVALPPVPGAPAKEQCGRVTRSMKQQQEMAKPLKMLSVNTAAKTAPPPRERPARRNQVVSTKPAPTLTRNKASAVEPAARATSTRSVNRPPVTAVPVVKDKPKDKSTDVRTTRSRANAGAPPSGRGGNRAAAAKNAARDVKEAAEEEAPTLGPCSEEVEVVEEALPADPTPAASVPAADSDQDPPALPSFAPQDFVFQAPSGLSTFKFEPLTPRSANAFLAPSSSFSFPTSLVFNVESQAEPSEPSPPKSPRRSTTPPRSSPTATAPVPDSPPRAEHDVPYFRSEIASETDRLTSLCAHWEAKVENESIPEEMRDRMRTAVGQARLLMKERFKQFSGLVDDCDLGRGEKITTCSDLQGFWDMVYFQVEDVNKKFDALKEAEARDWVEEHRPPPRQRNATKKPAAAAPAKPTGAKAAAAKSRLAAVKAAMKAKQQAAEAEKAAKATSEEPSAAHEEPSSQSDAQQASVVVFDGGFFQVESPAKAPGSARRSTRLAVVAQQPASPCPDHLSPRRVTRRSLALAQTPHAPTPAHFHLTLSQTPARTPKTPRASQRVKEAVESSLCFSPAAEGPDGAPAPQTDVGPAQEGLPSDPATARTPHSLPAISVEHGDSEPAQAADVDFPLTPRFSLSPCKLSPPAPRPAETSSALSFTLSPCRTPHQPALPSPAAICLSPAVQSPMEMQKALCLTPDSSVVEEIPGLDFERYLLPTQRCSPSPNSMVAVETLSPMAVDVEMESPRGQTEGPTQQDAALPSTLCHQSLQAQTAESSLLFFTPNVNDRIRQSVCPKDLMVFTPPL